MLLIKNIKSLVQVDEMKRRWVAGQDMAALKTLEDAFLFIKDGLIADYGKMEKLSSDFDKSEIIDAAGKLAGDESF